MYCLCFVRTPCISAHLVKVSISWADNAYKQEEKGNNIKPIEEVRVTGSGE